MLEALNIYWLGGWFCSASSDSSPSTQNTPSFNMSPRKRAVKSLKSYEDSKDNILENLSEKITATKKKTLKRSRKDSNEDKPLDEPFKGGTKDNDIMEEFDNQNTLSTRSGKQVKQPSNYEEVVSNLRTAYKELHIAEDPADSFDGDPKDKRYLILLSLIISSRTKDKVTFAATQKLIDHGCNLENILKTSDEKLGELIYPVLFWKNKLKYIRKTSEKLRDQFDGDIPKTVKELCQLDGVGPKIAHLCMKSAWGNVSGIAVDTHVFRLSKRLGWTKTNTPEDCETELESWIPQDSWGEIEELLVNFGQQICDAKKPKCKTCPNQNICPYGKSQLKKNK